MAIGSTKAVAAASAAAKPKAPAKKAAANLVEFEIRGESPGILRLIGVLDSVNDGTLMLKHKKHASSKYALTPIPLDNIRMIRGEAKVGQTVEITFFSEKAVFIRMRRAQLEGYDKNFGMNKGVDEQGRPFMIRPNACNATTMSEIAAPPVQIDKKF